MQQQNSPLRWLKHSVGAQITVNGDTTHSVTTMLKCTENPEVVSRLHLSDTTPIFGQNQSLMGKTHWKTLMGRERPLPQRDLQRQG